MSRFGGFAIAAVLSLVATVLWALSGSPLMVAVMSAGTVGWSIAAVYQWKEIHHGSNRKAEAGPPDPDPVTFAWASGGPVASGTLHYTFSTGSGPSASLTPPEPKLEVVESDQPILAQRAARLIFHGNSHHWASLNQGAEFGVDADARCNLREQYRSFGTYARNPYDHDGCPSVDCHCGFYAVPCDIEPWAEDGAYVTLLVELSGTIIEHEKGYRAGHQRVMECRIPPCRFCGAVAAVVDVRDNAMASACCEAHTPTAPDQVLVTLDDLRNLLPVPVTAAGRTEGDER